MRIIAGLYRGRALKTLRGLELRPTSDRLRETLFDVLGDSVRGCVFIDGYAGSGAVGLEAVSRGARQVFLLEDNAAAVRTIQGNVAALDVHNQAEIVRTPVHAGLRLLAKRGVRADFCFLDPPYAFRQEYTDSLLWLGSGSLMAPEGLIIVEQNRKNPLEEKVGRLQPGTAIESGFKRSRLLPDWCRRSGGRIDAKGSLKQREQ